MQQRSDIQGLRAYAVIAVILFHFSVPGFTGGFAGVDVFFVISGFLMTSIILRGLTAGDFSLPHFYLSRARRIIPALAVLCATLLLLGWFWLAPTDYAKLGRHSTAAAGFFSNFIFMDEEGYFDAPSQSKWLLHTWSLSVEWQFYMLYPLLLKCVARFGKANGKILGRAIIGLAIFSLAASIFLTPNAPAQSFYLLPTRAWELAAGGLVYLYAPALSARSAWVAELTGIALIVLSAHCFTSFMPWPGTNALLPVAGAALLLAAARQRSWLTGTRLAQWVGGCSYSIYLWHWPVYVALGYFAWKTPLWLASGIGASFLLGALSYYFVEHPARRYFATTKRATIGTVCAVLLLCGAGFTISTQHGIPARVSDEVRAIDAVSTDHIPAFAKPCGFDRKTLALTPCVVGDPDRIRWVVWGDSHAGSILSAVAAATHDGILYYSHACSTLFDVELKSKGASNHCTEFNHAVADQVAALPRHVGVIIANRYSVNIKGPNEGVKKPWGFVYKDIPEADAQRDPYGLYTERLTSTLCSITKHHAVYTVGPIPELGRLVPETMVRAAMIGRPLTDVILPLTDYRARNDVALGALTKASKQCGTHLLDPTKYLCDGSVCHGAHHGKPLYFDDNHLSESGNKMLVPMFAKLKP